MGIREGTLRELAAAKSLEDVRLIGERGGFAVSVRFGAGRALLETVRGERRLFVSLDTAARFLGEYGVLAFEVDAAEFRQERVRPARPDRAEALRATRTKPRQDSLL